MNDQPIETRPVNRAENLLREKFADSIANQSNEMDKLARQLITLELAIPGLYATMLKLLAGGDETVMLDRWLYGAFGLWAAALICTLISLFPRRWDVDTKMLKSDPISSEKVLSIEDFFFKSAQRKYRLLLAASILFGLGIGCAIRAAF